MIIVENVLLSDDIADKYFSCDLRHCRGACCIHGERGAPLEPDELAVLNRNIDQIRLYLPSAGIQVIEREGIYLKHTGNRYSTPLINGKECVYSYYDADQIARCGIERAFNENKISFLKPISCHLYPIRIKKLAVCEIVNYHQCDFYLRAERLGREANIPVYKFLKAPLIRKFGAEWYDKLVQQIEERKKV